MAIGGMAVALGSMGVALFIQSAVPALQGVTAMQICYLSMSNVLEIHPTQSAMYEAKSISGWN